MNQAADAAILKAGGIISSGFDLISVSLSGKRS